MNRTSLFRSVYLSYLSKPVHERGLYRAIGRSKVKSILEVGVHDGCRSQRLLEAALRHQPAEEVQFVGIDLFEARPAEMAGITLKLAFRELSRWGVKVKLLPGDPFSTLARSANSMTNVELVVIRSDQDHEALERAWFYLPRALSPQAQIWLETPEGDGFEVLNLADVEGLAEANSSRSRVA